MKQNRKELNVDAIGNAKPLSKTQEQEISAFIRDIKDSYALPKKSARSKSVQKSLPISGAMQ